MTKTTNKKAFVIISNFSYIGIQFDLPNFAEKRATVGTVVGGRGPGGRLHRHLQDLPRQHPAKQGSSSSKGHTTKFSFTSPESS